MFASAVAAQGGAADSKGKRILRCSILVLGAQYVARTCMARGQKHGYEMIPKFISQKVTQSQLLPSLA